MKYGINLLLWTDRMHDGLMPVLEQVKAMGYEGVEMPMFELNEPLYADWGKRLDGLALERTAVTIRGAGDNPISPSAGVRAAAVDAMKKTIDCCQAAGVSLLAGPTHSAIGEFSGAGPTEDEFKWGVETMQQVAEYAATAGVTIVTEYLNRFENYFLTSVDQTVAFVAAVDHPNVRMMYDTFHANIEEKDLTAAITAAMPWTKIVHISENDRSTPGQGHVAWDETFDAIKANDWNGWMVVEAFGLALPAIAAATKIWRKMYSTEEQLARDALAFMKEHVAKRWS
ncbi:MAG: sugar phosphate isomerase/epimerase [Planctomycetia bacterium]|jgi:D-psicose/D-tagatose/L-ribulose 3-epimerase|nr:sugar phosphate isomerase/epimerase [Planctomycetia bacterium]